MGLASAHGGLKGAGDPDHPNGFPGFGYAGAPSGPNINTLLGAWLLVPLCCARCHCSRTGGWAKVGGGSGQKPSGFPCRSQADWDVHRRVGAMLFVTSGTNGIQARCGTRRRQVRVSSRDRTKRSSNNLVRWGAVGCPAPARGAQPVRACRLSCVPPVKLKTLLPTTFSPGCPEMGFGSPTSTSHSRTSAIESST
jgi:hypothetical protein